MQKNTKVIVGLLVVLVVVLGIWFAVGRPPVEEPAAQQPAAQQPAAQQPAAQQPAAQQPVEKLEEVTLRISWWGSPTRHEQTLAVIDLFEERYPHITLEPEYGGWAGYWEKRAIETAAQELPDVMQSDRSRMLELVEANAVMPLDPFVEAGIIDLTNVDDTIIDMGKVDGKLYGVALGTNTRALIYDKALFEKAGVAVPNPKWTWDDFIQTSKRLHEALGIYGVENMPAHGFEYYLRQHGFELYASDGNKLGYEDDSIFVSYFSMMMELIEAGAMAGPAVWAEVAAGGVETVLVVDQRAAISTIHSSQNVAVGAAAGRELQLAMLPTLPGQVQEGHWLRGTMFFRIAANSEHPEEAAQFINFFVNDFGASEKMLGERGVPISSKVMEHLVPLLRYEQKHQFDFIREIAPRVDALEFPPPPGHGEVLALLERVRDMMALGEISLEDGAAMFRTEANAILAK